MHKQTLAIRTQTAQSFEMEHSTPLYLTSSFTFDTAEDMRAAFADESDDNIYLSLNKYCSVAATLFAAGAAIKTETFVHP